MKNKVTIVALMLMLGITAQSFSQCKDWIWPEDGDFKTKVEEKYAMHNDLVKMEDYSKARVPLKWLLENWPQLQSAIYINGEKIYKSLADEATDSTKSVFVDSLMTIYDLRIKQCGMDASILNRKAIYYFMYNFKDREKLPTILEYFDAAFEEAPLEMMDANYKYYMQAIQLNKVYLKELTDDEVLDRYFKIQGALNTKIENGGNISEIAKLKKDVTGILAKTLRFDCEKILTVFTPMFESKPDPEIAELVFGLMLATEGCTNEPLMLEAGKVLTETKPDFGVFKFLASKSKAQDDNQGAEKYFNLALQYAPSREDSADMEIALGHLDREANNYPSARTHYRSAANLGNNGAYSFIGAMYMNSFKQCAGQANIVKDRAVYLAAYKMYQLAGDNQGMASAKSNFPSVGEVFEQNMEKGQTIQVGCWIGESVTISTRD